MPRYLHTPQPPLRPFSAFLVTLVLISCSGPPPSRAAILDVVQRTIADGFYDPGFGGIDWNALYERSRMKLIRAEDEEGFFVGLNELLFELGVSHCAVIPASHPEWIGAPSVFSDGGVGITARVLDGAIVVTRIDGGSPAASQGIRPGTTLLRIDGRDLAAFVEKARQPPVPPVDPRMLLNQSVQGALHGPAGTDVALEYGDESTVSQATTLTRSLRPGRTQFMEGLPPMFLELEVRGLERGIGYVRFNSFHQALLERILQALDDFQDAPGLIIDLRGNAGGAFPVRRAIAERLVTEPCVIWRQRGRRGVVEVRLEPPAPTFEAPLVVIVDETSASSSEELAGGLQALGRASVVGVRTPGNVLIAEVVPLPDGSTLVYPVAQTTLADGSVLEGQGVVPDVEVALDAASLREGRDLQLEAAISLVR